MRQILKWLKKKLRTWIGIDRLDEETASFYREYCEKSRVYDKKFKELEYQNTKLRELNEFLVSQFNVSADLADPKHHRNWAVISIKGNPEYVKFVDLHNRDIREIADYLKRFEGTNRTVDSPFQIRGLFN